MTRWRLFVPILAVCVLGACTLAWYVIYARAIPSANPYRVRVVLPTSATLDKGANVMVAGLPVGRVQSLKVTPDGVRADLSLRHKYAPIPSDSQYGLRLRTLVGENYLEIFPGRSKTPLPDGGALPPTRNREYVDVDQILDKMRGPTRGNARRFMQGSGEGLAGRGKDLNATLDGLTGLVDNATPVVAVLDRRREALSRLVDNLRQVMSAIGQRESAITEFSTMARSTFTAAASRDAALRAMLARLPGLLAQVRATTGTLRSVTGHVAPVVAGAASALERLQPAIDTLPSAADRGTSAVRELGRAAPRLQRTVGLLADLSGPARSALPQVKAALCQVNPALDFLVPYQRELTAVLQGMGSSTNYYDATGHAARLSINIGENQAKFFDARSAAILSALVRTGVVSKSYKMGYDPIPPPGGAGQVATGDDEPRGPHDVPSYPHVEAAC